MYAVVELEAGSRGRGLFIPQTAIQDLNGQATVFVETRPRRFEPRPVETGRSLDSLVEIRRGLKAGERVAAEGAFVLKSHLMKSTLSED